ncbi:MAG: GntR family transcriptional regulator [Succinivibrio sp.]|nr:GntR family transcriptional regulator [Succinivibrio sp.]
MDTDLQTNVVYQRIRGMIIDGSFPLGSKISESLLAATLQAGRAPVRDALKILQTEKLVERKRRSGTYVFSLQQEEFDELLKFRYVMETQALLLYSSRELATLAKSLDEIRQQMSTAFASADISGYLKLDSRFHATLVESCHNRYFVDSYRSIVPIMDTLRNYLGYNLQHLKRSLQQHEEIEQALEEKNPTLAADLLAKHILPEHGAYWKKSNLTTRSTLSNLAS